MNVARIGVPADLTRRRRPPWVVVGGSAALILIGMDDGGYFPTAWSWGTFAFAAVAGVVLVVEDSAPARALLVVPGALLLLGLLMLVVGHGPSHVAEVERVLLYVSGLTALAIVSARTSSRKLAAGLLSTTTIVAVYALATRLFPARLGTFDDIATYRLAEPLGYWNALGVLSVMGAVLALGFVSSGRATWARALAGGAIPLLVVTTYFTFSRASWIGLALGLAAVLAFNPSRLSFLTGALLIAPFAGMAVGLASRQDALTTVNAEIVQATRQGERLALWLMLLAIGAGLAAAAMPIILSRLFGNRRAIRVYVTAVIGAGVLVLVLIFGRFGAPWTIASDAYDSFSSPPPRVQNLNDRLFTFSANRRIELWDTAWENYKDHPLGGSGAGTFERSWLAQRPFAGKVKDAHSLYLETLSELGPLGLALLLLALGVPVYAAFRARGHPLVPAAFGAYVAYLVHAGVDWDWEMPAVTLTALFIGASIVVAARKPEDEEKTMSPRLRYGLLAGTLALAAVAFVGLVGNIALAQSADEARAGDRDASESKARRAETWAPWSPEPWQRIGEAQLGRGELANARASFRKAIAKDERDWSLWLDLARASEGRAQLAALAQATKLNPLSPELAQLRKELAALGTIEVEG